MTAKACREWGQQIGAGADPKTQHVTLMGCVQNCTGAVCLSGLLRHLCFEVVVPRFVSATSGLYSYIDSAIWFPFAKPGVLPCEPAHFLFLAWRP